MAEANDLQMQSFCDDRVRTWSEQIEILIIRARQHKSAIDDIYTRAAGQNRWNDTRDNVPHKMQAGNNANPDDVLNFNACISSFLSIVDGTAATDADKIAAYNNFRATLVTLNRAVVRVIS
jgi:hypothetical protein